MQQARPLAALAVAVSLLAGATSAWWALELSTPRQVTALAVVQAEVPPAERAGGPPAEEPEPAGNPLLAPEATLVPPELLAPRLTIAEKDAMAAELYRLQTRNATDLVAVISSATEAASTLHPASFLLSIAFTETHGRILAVSPAGAAGLAQATPAAYLMEGFDGPLYLTNPYLIGTRAFIMKKPLGDAVAIAGRMVDRQATVADAMALLEEAKALRRVGIDELEALAPRAPEIFMQRVEAADAYNAQTFDTLERLLTSGASLAELTSFRARVQREYRELLRVQQVNWQRYADDLQRERDRVLRAHFRQEPSQIVQQRPYEAGEVLGERLDARFSPSQMAVFLAAHLATKRDQAIALGIAEEELEAWTAALYNGGLVNITRMRAGLMTSIRETQNYMRKVPELRERLDGAGAAAAWPG